MHRIVLAAAALLGAAGESPYEKTLIQMIGAVDSIGVTLKTIVDEDTAAASKPALRKANDTCRGTHQGRQTASAGARRESRLEKMYKPKLEESLKRMFSEIRRVENIPGGKDALKEIAGVLKKRREIMDASACRSQLSLAGAMLLFLCVGCRARSRIYRRE